MSESHIQEWIGILVMDLVHSKSNSIEGFSFFGCFVIRLKLNRPWSVGMQFAHELPDNEIIRAL